ncbi:hypothetical protein K456DRAFT_30281 [Colletotrichum gloeosporioides 23]|nr:hypothetical protein K456DRAFT_30281 [Colletotrichum gloeosporioides 23]
MTISTSRSLDTSFSTRTRSSQQSYGRRLLLRLHRRPSHRPTQPRESVFSSRDIGLLSPSKSATSEPRSTLFRISSASPQRRSTTTALSFSSAQSPKLFPTDHGGGHSTFRPPAAANDPRAHLPTEFDVNIGIRFSAAVARHLGACASQLHDELATAANRDYSCARARTRACAYDSTRARARAHADSLCADAAAYLCFSGGHYRRRIHFWHCESLSLSVVVLSLSLSPSSSVVLRRPPSSPVVPRPRRCRPPPSPLSPTPILHRYHFPRQISVVGGWLSVAR